MFQDEIHQKEKSEPSSRDIQNVSSEQITAAQTENSEHPNIDLSVGQRVEDSSVEVTEDQAQESQEKSYCQSQSGGDSQTKEDTQDGCESREQAHHATLTVTFSKYIFKNECDKKNTVLLLIQIIGILEYKDLIFFKIKFRYLL